MDVKPDNVFVGADGALKLGDFGLAVRSDGRSMAVREGDARYMPSEALNGDLRALDRVDIFALGISAYELARGTPLPKSGTAYEMLRSGTFTLMPGFSLFMQNLWKALMHPDAAQRPSAASLLRRLASKAAPSPPPAAAVPVTVTAPAHPGLPARG